MSTNARPPIDPSTLSGSATAASAPGQPPTPPKDLVGRESERETLRQVLSAPEGPVVCLYGPEGRGKTTLASAVASTLVAQGRFDRVVYVSLAGGLLPEIISDTLGVALLGPTFTLANSEQSAQLITALAAAPTLIIWDNVEVALAPDTPHYNAELRARLVALARELSHVPGCRLLLLLDTVVCPTDLAPLPLHPLELFDLSPAEAALLLQKRTAGALSELDASQAALALGGNPLALCCGAAYLADHSLAQLIEPFKGLLPGAQTVAISIELLLSDLSPDDRLAVNALGLFAHGFLEPLALRVSGLPADRWPPLEQRLFAAGLLTRQRAPGLNIGRIAPLPALQAHLARRVTPRQRQALALDLAQAVLGLWAWLPRGEERAPGLTHRLARLELANLMAAVELILDQGELNQGLELIQAASPALNELGLTETLAALRQRLDRATAVAIPPEGPLGRPAVQFMLRQAEALLQAGRAEQSAAVLQQLLQRITAEKGQSYPPPEAALDQGLAQRLMATLLRSAGQPEPVVKLLRQALAALGQARKLPTARQTEALVWRELTETLLLARQADAAEEAARRGIELAQQLDDLELVGGFQAQLGAVAVLRGDAEAALAQLEQAATHLRTAQAWGPLSNVWAQIAAVHETARQDLAAARTALTQAITVAAEAELPALQGQMLMQRARLQGRLALPAEIEADLQAAITLYQQAQLPGPLMAALRSLAEVYFEQQRWEQAQVAAQQARHLAEAASNGVAPWELYHLLQRIAAQRQDAEAEASWRARTQQAFARSPAAPAMLQQWFPLIRAVSEACRGSALSAETAALVENLEGNPQGEALAHAIWAVLGGARGPDVYRELDHAPAFIVRTILHGIEHPELFERAAEQATTTDAKETPSSTKVFRPNGG